MLKKLISIIKKIPKKYLTYISIVALISLIILLLSNKELGKDKQKGQQNENYIEQVEVEVEKVPTQTDLKLPKPQNDAIDAFNKYNKLAFKNTSLQDKTFKFDISNNSDEPLKLISLTVFEKSGEAFEEIYLDNLTLQSGELTSTSHELIRVVNPEILQYTYCYKLNNDWITAQVDLKNNAAYSGELEEDNIY